jgi:hypothetical protein
VHVANDGKTASQPDVDGDAVQVVSDGSTTEQPLVDGALMHADSDGSTEPHPVSDGFEMHWLNVGVLASKACTVTFAPVGTLVPPTL